MAIYSSPNGGNILFNFGAGGYTAPDFLNFDFKTTFSNTADLQASIAVLQLYTESTYTYVKSCRKIVIGYNNTGIQTLELPCLFGGIRDLSSYIQAISSIKSGYVDLPINIFGKPSYYIDLSAGVKALYKSSYDLGSLLNSISPVNLNALLNVIEVLDLPSTITGILFKGYDDLSVEFDRVTLKNRANLLANIRGWANKDLPAFIKSFHVKDLQAFIFSGYYNIQKNLAAYLSCLAPVNLQAYLHGYAVANLNSFTIVGYQPNDLPANIVVVQPKNLLAYIYGMQAQGNFIDLPATIRGFFTSDLMAIISTIEAKDLTAFITATGKYLDLTAYIVPKTINIKRILSVSLYEHIDLRAVINYDCLKSSYATLYASLYAIKKMDLKAYIIGWYGDKASNLLDLRAYINATNCQITDYNLVQGNTYEYTPPFTTHKISAGLVVPSYKTFNTYIISGVSSTNMLLATITGILTSKDLACSITAQPIANFTTLPNWVNPKTFEVVVNLNRFEERWYRFVEMMFFTNANTDYHFFYVPDEDKVYKVDRNRTWKVQVLGFSDDPTNIYSRVKINKKFLFRLDNYSTFDEALRDLMDRVSLNKSLDLSAYVNAYTYPSTDLPASLRVIRKRTWSLSCKAVIKCMQHNYTGLAASISPEIYHGNNNLTALIVGKAYEPPNPADIQFVFKDNTYVSPGSYNNMNWTYIQAEDFWKED